jgi:hypothetical protein
VPKNNVNWFITYSQKDVSYDDNENKGLSWKCLEKENKIVAQTIGEVSYFHIRVIPCWFDNKFEKISQ